MALRLAITDEPTVKAVLDAARARAVDEDEAGSRRRLSLQKRKPREAGRQPRAAAAFRFALGSDGAHRSA